MAVFFWNMGMLIVLRMVNTMMMLIVVIIRSDGIFGKYGKRKSRSPQRLTWRDRRKRTRQCNAIKRRWMRSVPHMMFLNNEIVGAKSQMLPANANTAIHVSNVRV